ncbi:MAG: tetrathionate reductase family octaheme c-type cytochrome [Planctomycetota bacterium]|jgi:octaheme c-type cytochrome (tetrathionate reductase family)
MRALLAAAPFLLVGIAVVVFAGPGTPAAPDTPWDHMPPRLVHTDHSALISGPFTDGPSVTRTCLKCHDEEAHDFMQTSHWSWVGDEVKVPGHSEPMRIGKKNLINNFCIGIQSNWPRCTSCHAGYGWADDNFDFSDPARVDCLVCHDTTGSYAKNPAGAGAPDTGIDLLKVARGVGIPSRDNCGVCHFKGGGGDAVKHGDLDGTMYQPAERIDVHMGRHDFACQDCHRTVAHEIPGRSMAVSVDDANRVRCVDCHAPRPHGNERLDAHTDTVACQTCHIPSMAVATATKMSWDWSTAGRDDMQPADPRTYSKKKGTFTFAQGVAPEYYWYNGRARRYIQGDKIDPEGVVAINEPIGRASDQGAKIWPFKVHRGRQVYDTVHNHLLVPKTFGKGGYWKDFDWDKALRLGSEQTELPYSGKYGFVDTAMYWPLSHMVARKEQSLQCTDCHGARGRLDWKALGFPGDPAEHGSR